jgi:hypothetical protein
MFLSGVHMQQAVLGGGMYSVHTCGEEQTGGAALPHLQGCVGSVWSCVAQPGHAGATSQAMDAVDAILQ